MSGDVSVNVRDTRDKKTIPAKILIIGDPSVGKTSLIKRYVKTQIDMEYLPTVGAQISKQPVKLLLGKEIANVSLMIWDIAGQDQFKILRKMYYNGAKGVIIVFDLTKPITLTDVAKWHAEAINYNLGKVPFILVGNKSDLKLEIMISDADIKVMKDSTKISDVFQTSALTGSNVTELFYTMAERIYSREKH